LEDTGPGIPQGIRDQLFEPFVTAGKQKGLGLGLALSRQTILGHNGEIWSEAATGARFVFRLPLNRARSSRERSQKPYILAESSIPALHPSPIAFCEGAERSTSVATDTYSLDNPAAPGYPWNKSKSAVLFQVRSFSVPVR
jgi:hypothetical protein